MENLIKTTLLGLFFGTFGTTLGGIIGISLKTKSNKFLSFMLALASGLMSSIVCFELIPQALEISETAIVLLGIILGILSMFCCDIIIERKFKKLSKLKKYKENNFLKIGVIISIGLAIHNLPEGLAIGSGFEISKKLGYSLAIAIALHDIPEGISMAIPMKMGGLKTKRIIIYIILSGVTTGIGAFLGAIIGEVSKTIISICLSFAAGAMLYIVSGELIPQSNKLYDGKTTSIGNIIGFIMGMFI